MVLGELGRGWVYVPLQKQNELLWRDLLAEPGERTTWGAKMGGGFRTKSGGVDPVVWTKKKGKERGEEKNENLVPSPLSKTPPKKQKRQGGVPRARKKKVHKPFTKNLGGQNAKN